MKLIILATVVIVTLIGVVLMNEANDLSVKRNTALTEVMKDLR